ncbi:MAG: hypothetical protein KF833_03505 [Verrucomicrobiae bacterium]|nr:hypothetical protein [Verrucomicrobiae bacterium]
MGRPVLGDGTYLTAADLLCGWNEEVTPDPAYWHGVFNVALVDTKECTLLLMCDDFGSLPLYYGEKPDEVLCCNSLRMARAWGLEIDDVAFAEQYALGYVVGERTLVKNLARIAPGSMVRLSLRGSRSPRVHRWSSAWSNCLGGKLADLGDEAAERWRMSLATLGRLAGRVGVMLSGGLDSRLVLGGFSALGADTVACTHGDPDSVEVDLAKEVARVLQVPWTLNAVDGRFSIENLHLRDVFLETELLVNPVWWGSGMLLQERNCSALTTGCLGDALIGGSYYVDASAGRRLTRNLIGSLGWTLKATDADRAKLDGLADVIVAEATKRMRHHGALLRDELRATMAISLAGLKERVLSVLGGYVGEGASKLEQVKERYLCEHRDRKFIFGQELQLMAFGVLVLPSMDSTFAPWLTNLDPALRYDHRLYYLLFRRLYPALAKIAVPNLYGRVDRAQFVMEVSRVVGRAIDRWGRRKARPRSWVNFNEWLRASGGLGAYERIFLGLPEIFEQRAVRARFESIRSGERSLYDGNESLGFIAAAWHRVGEARVDV